jgi:hypothetical protein
MNKNMRKEEIERQEIERMFVEHQNIENSIREKIGENVKNIGGVDVDIPLKMGLRLSDDFVAHYIRFDSKNKLVFVDNDDWQQLCNDYDLIIVYEVFKMIKQ